MDRLNSFLENGFLLVKGLIDPELAENLASKTKAILDENSSEDIAFDDKGVPRKICYMFDKSDLFMETLSNPELLSLAADLSPDKDQIVPTWEDLLVKIPNNGISVPPHQDLGLQSVKSGRVFSIGIYLNDGKKNPVYFLPQSHQKGALTFDEIKSIARGEQNNFIPVYANKGDAIVHNVLTVHYSEENISDAYRFTWYIEFRTVDELIEDSLWDNDWIYARRAILYEAIQTRKQKGLPTYDLKFDDYERFAPFLQRKERRVPHVTNDVDYDFNSPYFHFKD
jgi:ectoine hydroxylase-related dioxygenase (phytanoyl-CoA dioxygenase family)